MQKTFSEKLEEFDTKLMDTLSGFTPPATTLESSNTIKHKLVSSIYPSSEVQDRLMQHFYDSKVWKIIRFDITKLKHPTSAILL